jgi:hypothetical protein
MSGAAASMEPERWEEVLDHLSSMISGKRRADGATWRDAHENMPLYLQVLAAIKLLNAGQYCAAATVCVDADMTVFGLCSGWVSMKQFRG